MRVDRETAPVASPEPHEALGGRKREPRPGLSFENVKAKAREHFALVRNLLRGDVLEIHRQAVAGNGERGPYSHDSTAGRLAGRFKDDAAACGPRKAPESHKDHREPLDRNPNPMKCRHSSPPSGGQRMPASSAADWPPASFRRRRKGAPWTTPRRSSTSAYAAPRLRMKRGEAQRLVFRPCGTNAMVE